MKRSNFLKLSSVGILCSAIPALYGCRESVEYPGTISRPGVMSKIRDPKQIESIGDAYLKTTSNQSSIRTLARFLSDGAPADSTLIPDFIDQQITTDFRTGNIVIVNGWILSKTEARQCALYSLEQNI